MCGAGCGCGWCGGGAGRDWAVLCAMDRCSLRGWRAAGVGACALRLPCCAVLCQPSVQLSRPPQRHGGCFSATVSSRTRHTAPQLRAGHIRYGTASSPCYLPVPQFLLPSLFLSRSLSLSLTLVCPQCLCDLFLLFLLLLLSFLPSSFVPSFPSFT